MNGERSKQFKLFAIAGIAIIAVLIIIAAIIKVNDASKNATLSILVAPSNAKITIAGKEYKNGIYKLKPQGSQSVTIEADGFESQNLTVDINKNQAAKIQLTLKPKNNNYTVFLSSLKDYDSFKLNAETAEEKAFIEKTEQSLSLFELFTFQMADGDFDESTVLVKISRATDTEKCPQVNCVRVSAKKGDEKNNIETAKFAIEQKGYNPEDYEYYYVQE